MPSYWWVNHKQTYRQETDGGYIWSPKANANGARNVTYDNLSRCQRGDVVFSYAFGQIRQIGLVETAAITAQQAAGVWLHGRELEPGGLAGAGELAAAAAGAGAADRTSSCSSRCCRNDTARSAPARAGATRGCTWRG